MDFQLSLEKKIKCVAILINFVHKFEIIHKIHFSSSFFGKSENLTKLQFFCSFFEITISPKWASQMLNFDFKEPKMYFQRATNAMNPFPKLICWYNASFWKTRIFYSIIACFLQKVSDFQQFLRKKCAFFFQAFSKCLMFEKSSPGCM